MTTAGIRLRVDPVACDGRGLCAEVLPELITLDDWGFPIISDAEVPPGLMAAVGEAIRLCPLLALRLASAAARPPRPSPPRQPPSRPPGEHREDQELGANGLVRARPTSLPFRATGGVTWNQRSRHRREA